MYGWVYGILIGLDEKLALYFQISLHTDNCGSHENLAQWLYFIINIDMTNAELPNLTNFS